jgi:acyl-CoA thioesterase-1
MPSRPPSPSRRYAPALALRALFAIAVAGAAIVAPARAATAEAAGAPVILVVGDSISAAYGLPGGTGWTDLLARRLAAERQPHRVVNASISGDTTAGGRSRLPALLARHQPAVVVIELGGNDALRGGDLAATRANLDAMVVAAQAARARVLIVGMRVPPNYGAAYGRGFETLFADVARARRTALVPFFFEGFGDRNELFQPDRIHPSVAAQPLLLDNLWPALVPLLKPR